MSSQEDSEDPNLVIIPVEDSLSDGSLDTWPKGEEGRFTYDRIDDSKWRATLASLWVEKTGAQEKGMSASLVSSIPFLCEMGSLDSSDQTGWDSLCLDVIILSRSGLGLLSSFIAGT